MNGRMWRLLRDWYDGAECAVRYSGQESEYFGIGRGVKQGSILSPTLFLLIMDLLLRRLQSSQLGLSIDGFYMQEVSFMQMISGLFLPVKRH